MRRSRPLRTEPLVFAVLLTLLTLGINLTVTPVHEPLADQQSEPSHMASVH